MWKQFVVLATLLFCDVYSHLAGDCVCVLDFLCGQNTGIIGTRFGGETAISSESGSEDGDVSPRGGFLCNDCNNCSDHHKQCCFLPKPEDVIPDDGPGCGYHNPGGLGRAVVAEHESQFGEVPSLVQIIEDRKYKCAGSLINPSVVLTAAHCVHPSRKNHYIIRAGEWDTSNANELFAHQDRFVSSIERHEGFRAEILHNDIALVFLSQPFRLQPHVNLACLASTVPKNGRCFTVGWGIYTTCSKKNFSYILTKHNVQFIDRNDCQATLRNNRFGEYFSLHKRFICAGGEGRKRSCLGDEGAPLFCPGEGQEDRYQQVGVFSWGLNFTQEKSTQIYTNVALMRRWIDKEVAAKNFDPDVYEYNNV